MNDVYLFYQIIRARYEGKSFCIHCLIYYFKWFHYFFLPCVDVFFVADPADGPFDINRALGRSVLNISKNKYKFIKPNARSSLRKRPVRKLQLVSVLEFSQLHIATYYNQLLINIKLHLAQ